METRELSASAPGCPRLFETVQAVLTERGNDLLLAPLDADAAHVLSRAIERLGWEHSRRGSALLLLNARPRIANLRDALLQHIPTSVQVRIKGVLMNGAAWTAETLLGAFLRSETLPVLFEQTEVAWVSEVFQRGLLFSVYHPIVDAADGQVFAYEALIRATHPETGETVGAGQLIHAAGRMNLQRHFDQRARETAIRCAAAFADTDLRLFVNFAPGAIYEPELCLQSTVQAARETGIDMRRLVFEVIETEQIPSMDRLRKLADYYRSQGAGIALDDISSGFSSLQYLTDLLPDYVKVDRDLVASAEANSSARHTLESIVGLARKLNVRVIAEGIETRQQLAICLDAGVDYLQGYLFGMPAFPPQSIPPGLFDCQLRAA